jgi:hypothetical protein
MDTQHFTVVAGFEAEQRHAQKLAQDSQWPGFSLTHWQESSDPTVAVEIVETIKGYSLRYATGLRGFELILPDLGTLGEALQASTEWVNSANAKRGEAVYFAFIRNTTLANAGKVAEKVAKRRADQAEAERKQVEAQHTLGYHTYNPTLYANRCQVCAQAGAV